MIAPSRQRSIAAKLTWMNVLVSGIALLLVYISYLTYNVYSLRDASIQSLSGEARIIGANSVSAIEFDDRASAETTLSALRFSSDVVAAAIYTTDGAPFAQYPANGAAPPQPRTLSPAPGPTQWTDGADILIGSRISFQGKQLGTVYLQAHLQGLRRQALQFAGIAAAILVFCMVVALLVGTSFRRTLAQPIVSLADTARLVSRYRDYSLRFASDRSYDELASLTDAFNEMLTEIQSRDAALQQSRVELELRVEERTAELQTANRELEAFSYTVAHDLRGPLQTIGNVCYLLGETDFDASRSESKQMLGQLGFSVNSMSRMIDDLLDLSRSTSAPLRFSQIDLGLLANSILESLAEADAEKKVEIAVEAKCHANADPGLMQIVLQNLLRNAWKFTGKCEVARIEFGCAMRGKTRVFYVRDNGAGFDQNLAERLFKPFQRLHAASDFPGTGIGLATVQRIIGRHGGEVWAEGVPEKGATFYFTLDAPRPPQP
jgi:signal transduction histidine kinase